jgi:hypothetical protein
MSEKRLKATNSTPMASNPKNAMALRGSNARSSAGRAAATLACGTACVTASAKLDCPPGDGSGSWVWPAYMTIM